MTEQKHALKSKTVLIALFSPILVKAAEYFGVPPDVLINAVVLYIPIAFTWLRGVTAGGVRWGKLSGAKTNSPWLVGIVALLLVGLLSVMSACAAKDMRTASYGSMKVYELTLNLSMGMYRSCQNEALSNALPVDRVNAEIDCFNDHQSRIAKINAAEPYLQATVEAARAAPESIPDDSISRARAILGPLRAALLTAANENQKQALAPFLGVAQ